MLNSRDIFNIRRDLQQARADYRDVWLVHPVFTSGSNYNQFTDGPLDISADQATYLSPVFTVYRCKARIKIINPISLLGLGPVIPGVEIGDYLLMFRPEDKGQVDRVIEERHGYIYVDGYRLKPVTTVYTGLTQNDDVMAHCKRKEPEFRATGL